MQIKEYLNEICEQIKYKPVRKEIAKEIEDHINDIKEDLKNNGEDEEKAEIKAISQMGNAKEIGKKLNKIHKPKLDWKLLIITLVLIFFGFIVSFIKTINNTFEANELNFMTRYILVTLFGTILGIVAYFGNYKKVQKYSYLLYIIASGIIIYTFLFGYLSYMKIGNRYISATTIAIPLYIISFVGFLMEKSTKNFLEIKILNKLIKVKDNLIKLLLLAMISIVLIGMLPSKASVIILTLNYLILLSAKMILTQKNNIKTVLIILVVLGHALEEISLEHEYGIIRACIYSFHMPAFIFISGYFSGGGYAKESKKIIVNCGIPYFIFNTIYVIWTEKTFFVNVFLPKYIFWYFFSLLIWRLFINDLKKIKGLWLWALLFGLYIGVIREADRFMSISRIIAFFPYFIIGSMLDEERVRKIRRVPKRYAILLSVLMACTVILLHINALVPVKSYENIQCYNASGMSNLQGIIIRVFSYVIGFMATL